MRETMKVFGASAEFGVMAKTYAVSEKLLAAAIRGQFNALRTIRKLHGTKAISWKPALDKAE